MSDSQTDLRSRLKRSCESFNEILEFETSLREHIVGRIGPEWRRRVPGDVKKNAKEVQERDRESAFAQSSKYHQVYYCYLDDLKKIVTCKANAASFFAQGAQEITVRFDELVALRNRAAHGRFLREPECDRVGTIVRELGELLSLEFPESLTEEDPVLLCVCAQAYVQNLAVALDERSLPEGPVAIANLMRASCIDLDEADSDLLRAVHKFAEGCASIPEHQGYKILIAKHEVAFPGIRESLNRLSTRLSELINDQSV